MSLVLIVKHISSLRSLFIDGGGGAGILQVWLFLNFVKVALAEILL